MHEGPNGPVINLYATLSQFGLQAAQGEGLIVGRARNQPVPMRQQKPWPMAVHRTGRRVAGLTKPL